VENVAMVTRRVSGSLSTFDALVDFDPELIALVLDALKSPPAEGVSSGVMDAISETCNALAPYLGHFGKIPKLIGKRAAKQAAKRQFENALRVILRWTLNPETSLSALSDLREVVNIVRGVLRIEIGLEVAEA